MNEIERLLARDVANCKKGVVTPIEVVNSLVRRIIDNGEVPTVTSYINSLPSEIRDSLDEFLVRVRSRNYRWRPLVIGEPIPESEEERYATALKQIDSILNSPRS